MPTTLTHRLRVLKHQEQQAMQVTRTTDDDDLILRFLAAASARVKSYDGRVPMNSTEANAAISWLRGLVGKINEDGSITP